MGAKNAVLKVIASTLLTEERVVISNIPQIFEIPILFELMKELGTIIEKIDEHTYAFSTPEILTNELPIRLVNKIRSSLMTVGPILARTGRVTMPHPGGCALGKRPIDFFIKGFEALGVRIIEHSTHYELVATEGIRGGEYFFPRMSHTGTESMIMSAVLAKGKTTIYNAACEPEIVSLAEHLIACGARISGHGTHTIIIEGVAKLSGGEYMTIPDRLEAGTFSILAALRGRGVTITHANPQHLQSLWNIFETIGITYSLGTDTIFIPEQDRERFQATGIITHEYPGLATDLQPPLTLLMTQCNGTSLIHDPIFDGRLFYTDILNQMGAKIILCDPHRALVTGPTPLVGRKIISPDIRAGMALLLAGILADGETIVQNVYQIDRGYERIDERLRNIGVDITRTPEG
jgi:UDP-N-acetylglucosamine 1-carboxyvinyltransferase